jgi:hypothetical protein
MRNQINAYKLVQQILAQVVILNFILLTVIDSTLPVQDMNVTFIWHFALRDSDKFVCASSRCELATFALRLIILIIWLYLKVIIC